MKLYGARLNCRKDKVPMNKMQYMRAVVVDPSAPGLLALQDVAPPRPVTNEALVRVAAIALTPYEIKAVASAEAGTRPGWEFAGTVERAAADDSGPREGARVAGFLDAGAWAQWLAVPTAALGVLPDGVSFAQAATLPIAGLTALYALERGGPLLGRSVLVTGASGGVGQFACQLARRGGAARVVGVVRSAAHAEAARAAGAQEVVVGEDNAGAERFGPYDVILDSVGGASLATALPLVAEGGTCVAFGTTGGGESIIRVWDLYGRGGVSLYGFLINYEVKHQPIAEGLPRLARMVAEGTLRTSIGAQAPWTEIAQVGQGLLERRFIGKAVLLVGEA
jgi:NADPH:quinone reductase-like Zn-dependent oxidoreductase